MKQPANSWFPIAITSVFAALTLVSCGGGGGGGGGSDNGNNNIPQSTDGLAPVKLEVGQVLTVTLPNGGWGSYEAYKKFTISSGNTIAEGGTYTYSASGDTATFTNSILRGGNIWISYQFQFKFNTSTSGSVTKGTLVNVYEGTEYKNDLGCGTFQVK